MKKLVFLFFAFGIMQVSAQSLSSLAKSAALGGVSIEALAGDQVKRLTKKLNLSEQQEEQVSGLVVSQLKSEKFQKLLGSVGADKLMSSGSKSDISDKVESTLMTDDSFKKEMSSILDDKQKEALKKNTPH